MLSEQSPLPWCGGFALSPMTENELRKFTLRPHGAVGSFFSQDCQHSFVLKTFRPPLSRCGVGGWLPSITAISDLSPPPEGLGGIPLPQLRLSPCSQGLSFWWKQRSFDVEVSKACSKFGIDFLV